MSNYNTMVKVRCLEAGAVVWANSVKTKGSGQDYRCTKCGKTGHDVVRG